jgi:hypothetical protein
MGISVSGTLTLLFLVFIGPFMYACSWAYKKFLKWGTGDNRAIEPAKEEGQREELGSSQYLFALIGYAIGTYSRAFVNTAHLNGLLRRLTFHLSRYRDWQHLALPVRYRKQRRSCSAVRLSGVRSAGFGALVPVRAHHRSECSLEYHPMLRSDPSPLEVVGIRFRDDALYGAGELFY